MELDVHGITMSDPAGRQASALIRFCVVMPGAVVEGSFGDEAPAHRPYSHHRRHS